MGRAMNRIPRRTDPSILKEVADQRRPNMFGLDDQTPLWRVFQTRHLLDAVRNKRLVLVKPSCWDDPFENFLSQCDAHIVKANVIPWSPR